MKQTSSRTYFKNKPSTSHNMAQRETRRRCKSRFSCNWNSACKALFLGLVLMFIGGSMATVGYFVDHIYKTTNEETNDTGSVVKEKSRLNINSVSTYVGPMIMGVGGFIVVAACVMTFEQRDNAAKVVPNRLQLTTSGHAHSINRHNKPSPSSRAAPTSFREGSGRKHTAGGSQSGGGFGYLNPEPVDQFCRRELTADFIQFSRNLQQASLKKRLVDPSSTVISRCPSAPNLVASMEECTPLHRVHGAKKNKHSRNSLHPLIGYPSLSPRSLQRQAISVDHAEYYPPKNASLPCSKYVSRQGSTSTAGKGSAESLESAARRSHQTPKGSMNLDLRIPSPLTGEFRPSNDGRLRERNKRSDTARRHLLVRQAPIEFDDESCCDKEFRGSSPQFGNPHVRYNHDGKFQSTSTPHSRRESYSPRIPSVDGSPRFRQIESIILRESSSPTLRQSRGKYLRSNTIGNETHYRRDSNTSDMSIRKGSADYNYRSRRKSSNTSDSSNRYCSRIVNTEEGTYTRVRRNSRSPTPSLKSYQECRAQNQREKLRRVTDGTASSGSSKSKNGSKQRKHSGTVINRSVSPDSLSVSSSATEGYSRTDYISIEMEEDAQDKSQ